MFAKKQNILALIAGLNVINNDAFSRLKNNYLNPQTRGGLNNSLFFLLELIKILLGWRYFKTIIIEIITYSVDELERVIKNGLIKLLKKKFSCSVDGIIPDIYIDNGIKISKNQIDYLGLLAINPADKEGSFFYGDAADDLNHVIYLSINSQQNWKNLFSINYLNFGVVEGVQTADIFNVKIDESYRGKNIADFVNDFFLKTDILNPEIIISSTFDLMFGNFSSKKNLDFVKKQEELIATYDQYINQNENQVDNSYYDFKPTEKKLFNIRSNELKNSVRVIGSCNGNAITLNDQEVFQISQFNTTNPELIEQNINNTFNVIEKQYQNNFSTSSEREGMLEFVFSFFKNIIYAILNQIYSPKIMLFFSIYFKVVFNEIGFKNLKEFIELKRELFKNIIRNVIIPFFVRYLAAIVAKSIAELAANEQINKQKEKARYYTLQIQSLLGINTNI